jgi:methyl acetate hydrolase
MSDLDRVLTRAVETEDVPFVVGMVANANGVTFSGAAGDSAPGRPAAQDTAFRIFSMTKGIGALAAMILIDRGKMSMDTLVADVLPTWNDMQVLDGFDGDTPILRAPKTQATARHLATHTSGLEYEFWNADMPKYMEVTGLPTILSGLKSSLMYPLTTDPGTRWGYGTGIDWLGQMVEAVDGRRIDAFCREEIFEPLGMADTAFEPDALVGRMSDVSIRGEDGKFAPLALAPPPQPEFYGMGHALYSTAPDYLRFLRMVLDGGQLDGNRVLSPEAMQLMLADQMRGLTFRPMQSVSPITADVDLFPSKKVTHSFAFMRNEEAVEGKRSAGSMGWAGVIMTQSLPFVEPPMLRIYDAFERAVYAGL